MKIKIQKLLFLKIHPSPNLPAPINVGSIEQTKTGNLVIEGVLRLGQFTTVNEPTGTEGALYYNTTDNAIKVYSDSDWSDLVEPDTLALGEVCTLDSDCTSTYCVDAHCCDTTCTGNCNRCNVAGALGVCTDATSDCTGNCDVCSSGNCAASASLCTGNCDQCTGSGTSYSCSANASVCTGNCDICSGSGTAYNCEASVSLCTGNCDQCTGSGTSYSCSANASVCTGNCDVCSGSGTAYNCEASNALCSNTTASCGCSGSGTVFNCQSCSNPYPSNCGYATCDNYTCGGEGAAADSSGTMSGQTVYCDEHNRLWTPTQSGTYAWTDALSKCTGLTYAGNSDWVLPTCTSGTPDAGCIVYQFAIDACGGYTCTPAWDALSVADHYWSSTQLDGTLAKHVTGTGAVWNNYKYLTFYVRCVYGQ